MTRLGSAIAVSLIAARCLSAQAPPPTPCELTEDRVHQAVNDGHPESLQELRGCPERGTRLLNLLWLRGTASPQLLPYLRRATEAFRTSAIFHMVETAANNPAASDPLRLTALQVLLKYVDPELELPDDQVAIVTPRDSAIWPCAGCRTMAWDSSYTPPLRGRALATFERLARDGTPDLRRVATAILDALPAGVASETPIASRTLTGTLECGTLQLTITNSSPVDWPVSVTQGDIVDPIRPRGTATPPASLVPAVVIDTVRTRARGTWGGGDGLTRLTLTDRSPVTLTFGDRVMFRLECPAEVR